MTSWNERLRLVMAEKKLTSAALVRATGVSPAGVKKWVDGNTTALKYDDVMNICKLTGVSPQWLMHGEGQMLPQPTEGMISLERVCVVGSCGFGVINFESVPSIEQMLVTPEWFQRHFAFYKPSNIKIISANGDSMTPEIDDGDAVFIDVSDKETLRDGIYALVIDGEFFLKRIQKLVGRKIALLSSNPAYKDIEVPLDGDTEVLVVGRVVKSMKLRDH